MQTPHTTNHLPPQTSLGGKAYRLSQLTHIGMPIPRWTVWTTEELTQRFHTRSTTSPTVQLTDFHQRMRTTFGPACQSLFYAVRSSAIEEDGSKASFAGQFKTFLHVPYHRVPECIAQVWQSANAPHIEAYRKYHNLSTLPSMAVIVQEMVYPTVSGVAFSCNPRNGRCDEIVINAVYGLGEGLVSGQLNADEYIVRKKDVEAHITEKTWRYVAKPSGGVQRQPLPKALRRTPTLTTQQCLQLAQLIQKLHRHFQHPQDVEFALADGHIYILQSRDITALTPMHHPIVWDNSNIVESYPGVTTPLTFSFIQKMYEGAYRQLAALLGVPRSQIERHSQVFAQTLGLIRGRVYYNLLHWYKMLAMVPGYALNARFMEQMMGVGERFDIDDSYVLSRRRAILHTLRSILRMIALQVTIRKSIRRFQRFLNTTLDRYRRMDFARMSAEEILAHYRHFETTVLQQWKAPLVNDFFTMIWHGLLYKMVRRIAPDHPSLHNALLAGSRDIASTKPIRRFHEMIQFIRSQPQLIALFTDHSAEEIWSRIQTPVYASLRTMLVEYIDKYGDRSSGELKLESITYRVRPTLLIEHLQMQLHNSALRPLFNQNTDLQLRRTAEAQIRRALRGKPLLRWVFSLVLRRARYHITQRENLRLERTRAFGMVRTMFRALGSAWHRQGYLSHPEDIFYLKREELLAARCGVPHPQHLRAIEERKHRFAAYRQMPDPPPRLMTTNREDTDDFIPVHGTTSAGKATLQGTGCCPGIVTGRVRIVRHPNEVQLLNGEILVAHSTDPGWVILFPSAAGIIVERGSLLSHTAIVAREMGIPCIVGAQGALQKLHTGDRIWMNGANGEIRLLQSNTPNPSA